MERERLNGDGNWNYNYTKFGNDYYYYYGKQEDGEEEVVAEVDPLGLNCNGVGGGKHKNHFLMTTANSYPFPSSSTIMTSPMSTPSPPLPGGVGFIEHPVSKLDTLAGVAIKYGVEVADIKKMNGLVTDLQMFALKSLQIPLPGKHPPSPGLSNGSNTFRHNTSQQTHSDLFDSFPSLRLNSSQRKVSSAMSSLQGYYGLKSETETGHSQGFEMADYRQGDSHYLEPSPASNTPLSHHRKSRSLANGFRDENNGVADDQLIDEERESDTGKWIEKLLRRRQKSDADFSSRYPEMLMREDTVAGVSSAITGKSLALRSKAASRTASPLDAEAGGLTPVGMGDSLLSGGFYSVRKSSSTSSLNDQDNGNSSIWPTSKWSLTSDLQALSAAAIARPIFDGLPKPITGRRNKTALD
ncbi:hypothetical protein JCGZ_24238 [Jatropha curcas]|uniref:LysM domain-containing protein n=1 Tax=Jatropha curcas TaxID=180498 RepID=A0A067L4J1_JATCU|nr:uncharacterized protein LOC105628931 [Jatropha curcas]KDP43317.1 hypothetical protein JCGZ_24238 [Jatropha curcas]